MCSFSKVLSVRRHQKKFLSRVCRLEQILFGSFFDGVTINF